MRRDRIAMANAAIRDLNDALQQVPTMDDGYPSGGWSDLDSLIRLAITEAHRVVRFEGEPRVEASS